VRATTDLAQLRVWFEESPGSNWAVATGAASGIFVLDVDTEEAFCAMFGRFYRENFLPHTLVTRSGSGGYHLFFQYPAYAKIGCGPNILAEWHPQLHIKGDGGYVMIPPSVWRDDPAKARAEGRDVLPDRRYEFIDGDAPIAEAPRWLIEAVGGVWEWKTPNFAAPLFFRSQAIQENVGRTLP
jgi:hypothetical protein